MKDPRGGPIQIGGSGNFNRDDRDDEIARLAAEVDRLQGEKEALRAALAYWLPDETMVPDGHEDAWNDHQGLLDDAALARLEGSK